MATPVPDINKPASTPSTGIADNSVGADRIPKWALKVNKWRRRIMSEFIYMLWLAFFIGIFAGFAAFIFNRLISIVTDIFTAHIMPGKLNWWLIPVPVAGILITGIFTRYIVRTNLTHGVTQLSRDLNKGLYRLRRNIIYSPIIGSTITLGFGGSAGSEGPIAYSGAAIGSNVGRVLGVNEAMMKILIACGAGAGISGIFQSPMGGLLFTIEYLRMDLGAMPLLAVTLACFVAYGIVFICHGCVPSHTFTPIDTLEPHHYWAVMAFGVFCGIYALYYSAVINRTDGIFIKIQNPWVRNISGGIVIGISIFLFPSLYGVGYPILSDTIHARFNDLINGNVLMGIHMGAWEMIIVATCILIIKCWACGTCNACGGVSSDFAPTMFAGGICGFLFTTFCNHMWGLHLPVGLFTFLGMSGVMAGAVEAPLMTIFIVLSMGMSYDFALPIAITVLFSYVTVRIGSHVRGYDSMMMKHLHWFHHRDNVSDTTSSPEANK